MTASSQSLGLDATLAAAIDRHDVPGASLALLVDGEVHVAAAGLLSRATGVEATPDSLFQIGSISKTFTATLAMQLVDRGELSLDTRVADVIPGFRVGDPRATAQTTIAHLLTHTSGIGGDAFIDTGRGDDAVAQAVRAYAYLGQDVPFDSRFSYSNAGFVILGRVIELVCGRSWDAVLRERLLDPMGLERACTLPEEALLHRAAVGHIGEDPQPAPAWVLPRGLGPSGLICATAAELLEHGRLHLHDGRSAAGEQLLSAESARAMREQRASLDGLTGVGATGWGLGWMLREWDGCRVFGHDGGTIGQFAFLHAIPARGAAIALLTNGGLATDCFRDLARDLLGRTCGLTLPPDPEPLPGGEVDPALAGVYEAIGNRVEVAAGDGALHATIVPTEEHGELFGEELPPAVELRPLEPERGIYAGRAPHVLEAGTSWVPVTFPRIAGEQYVHFGGRALRRVG
ncbi:serine hydrolase domain-containing protein [Conexibacter arvalis]|uniref:CubicO group peptidase (Beta-lactamase class C family) n=1 Tax=Conexibacter arvalis TaxID=912552 RepID=A0A840IJD9_9ACTN|nr:serine hydrolase domain-containing protein [Conexibacter arvalis]MBB4665132.1 CubicO group peptidase (beta-lactamase class C family) [Conexibacter arvalis]